MIGDDGSLPDENDDCIQILSLKLLRVLHRVLDYQMLPAISYNGQCFWEICDTAHNDNHDNAVDSTYGILVCKKLFHNFFKEQTNI